jgi:hypothetical protein
VWPLEAFYVHDDTTAVVGTLTAEIKVTQPRELADYAKAFAGLAEMAVYGDDAWRPHHGRDWLYTRERESFVNDFGSHFVRCCHDQCR